MLRLLKENLTLFYVLLIFIGFINNHFYYDQFDIEIHNYFTVIEFLFSFISFSVELLLGLSLLVFLLVGMVLGYGFKDEEGEEEKEKGKENEEKVVHNFRTSIVEAARDLWKDVLKVRSKWTSVFQLPFSLISFGLTLSLNIFLIVYPFVFIEAINGNNEYIDSEGAIGLAMFWFLLLYGYRSNAKFIIHIVLTAFIFVAIWTINYTKARKVMSGNPEFIISFKTADTTIVSDTITVFVGKTKQNIFLRDLNKKENLIYDLKDVAVVNMKKRK